MRPHFKYLYLFLITIVPLAYRKFSSDFKNDLKCQKNLFLLKKCWLSICGFSGKKPYFGHGLWQKNEVDGVLFHFRSNVTHIFLTPFSGHPVGMFKRQCAIIGHYYVSSQLSTDCSKTRSPISLVSAMRQNSSYQYQYAWNSQIQSAMECSCINLKKRSPLAYPITTFVADKTSKPFDLKYFWPGVKGLKYHDEVDVLEIKREGLVYSIHTYSCLETSRPTLGTFKFSTRAGTNLSQEFNKRYAYKFRQDRENFVWWGDYSLLDVEI